MLNAELRATMACPHRAMTKAVSIALAARRLAAVHWALPVVCALFLLVGALVLDDYGISTDANIQRQIGMASVDYLAGQGERAYDLLPIARINRYYGVAFEAPLILVERALGLEDSRDVHLSRHYLTHLFFLAGGVFCYLLVLRMFGSRLLALVAMVLFLLHPRLYAHSFFNSKDVPFAAMFMIALYLTHRAFRRDTLGAFLACGIGLGLLINLRLLGLALLAAVLALRGMDLLFAAGTWERKRILLTAGAVVLGAMLTFYTLYPGIWTDPIGEFMKAYQVSSTHPQAAYNLFRGEWLFGPDGAPFEYIPLWLGISTPPVVLLLGVIGVAGLCRRATRHPRDLWHESSLRFDLLLVVLIVGTIIAVFVGKSNIYNGWRHVYFLYAPLVILAAVGLHWIQTSTDRRWVRRGIHMLAGVGVAVTLVSMVRIHPLEDSYYNALVDRTTPDYLVSRYETGMGLQLYWPLIRAIVEDHPDQELRVTSWDLNHLLLLLPESQRNLVSRDRVIFSTDSTGFHSDHPVSEQKYVSSIYNNTLIVFRGRQVKDGGREVIVREALFGEPVSRSFFDIYLHENMLVFIRGECVQDDVKGIRIGKSTRIDDDIGVEFYPRDTAVLSSRQKDRGRASMKNTLGYHHILDDDGRCSWVVLLPDYPVYRFYARQSIEGYTRWEADVGIGSPVDPEVLESEPLLSGVFDIHRYGERLVYVKDGCTKEEEEAEFLAFFSPVDPEDLPEEVGRGDAVMRTSFRLWNRGVRVGDRCITTLPLPDWPVASVRTGQYGADGYLWQLGFALTTPDVDPDVLAGEPLDSGAFDIHRDGDALVYVKDECTEDDAEAPIIFHVYPVDPGDLPDERREYGFENRDFYLWDRGARVDGRCLVVVPLPDYPIASVYTGQYDETGQLWTVEFALAGGE